MITVVIPPHMKFYAEARKKTGLSNQVCIDPCILTEILSLWNKEIITYGCCCGHNINESFVNVDNKCIEKMIKMGYKMNHTDKTRRDTFRLKSAG